MPALMTIQDKRRVVKRSRPLPGVESKAINLYDWGLVLSLLAGFLIAQSTVVRNGVGCHPVSRQKV